MTMLESETQAKASEKERTLAEKVPALQLSGLSLQDLQVSQELQYFKPSPLKKLCKSITKVSERCVLLAAKDWDKRSYTMKQKGL